MKASIRWSGRVNSSIFFLGVMFGIAETHFFGWHFWPQSEAELICDGITLVLFALSFGWRPAVTA